MDQRRQAAEQRWQEQRAQRSQQRPARPDWVQPQPETPPAYPGPWGAAPAQPGAQSYSRPGGYPPPWFNRGPRW